MPTRPIQHELEEASRIAFESLVAPWLYRRKTPDYGIDGEVEIFDERKKASGLQFLVQLKAEQRARRQTSIPLGIEWIKYYQSLELPVLLVLWVKETGKTFWLWATEIDLYYAKKNAKTYTVHLTNEWGAETRTQLQKHIDFHRQMKARAFRRPLKIHADAPGRPGLGFRLQALCAHVPEMLTYVDDADITCTLRKDELKVAFSGYYGAVLHAMRTADDATAAKRAMIGVVLTFAHFGAVSQAAELWAGVPDLAAEVVSMDVAWRILSALTRAGAYPELRATLRMLRGRFAFTELVMPLHTLRFTAPAHRRRGLTEFLIELDEENLVAEAEPVGRSIASYSLGRLWEEIDLRKARKYFVRAIRESAFYADKGYFWNELGSSLFNRRRYRAALRCYQYAYEKLGDKERRGYFADALMHTGKYSDALRLFQEIVGSVAQHEKKERAHLEWISAKLKSYALLYLREVFGISAQERQARIAVELVGDCAGLSAQEIIERCDRAIKADALCGVAWRSRAVALHQQGKDQDALSSFVVAATVNTSDDQTWLNILSLVLKLQERSVLSAVLMYLTYERGNAFVRYVTETANIQSDEKQRELLMQIAKLIDQQIPREEKAHVRLHSERGTETLGFDATKRHR